MALLQPTILDDTTPLVPATSLEASASTPTVVGGDVVALQALSLDASIQTPTVVSADALAIPLLPLQATLYPPTIAGIIDTIEIPLLSIGLSPIAPAIESGIVVGIPTITLFGQIASHYTVTGDVPCTGEYHRNGIYAANPAYVRSDGGYWMTWSVVHSCYAISSARGGADFGFANWRNGLNPYGTYSPYGGASGTAISTAGAHTLTNDIAIGLPAIETDISVGQTDVVDASTVLTPLITVEATLLSPSFIGFETIGLKAKASIRTELSAKSLIRTKLSAKVEVVAP